MNTPPWNIVSRSAFLLIFAATAVAAFGTTFHFFGSSAIVPEPSRQFGFWVLSPIALIDRVYFLFAGARLIWDPIPMFLVLWVAYAAVALMIFFWVSKRKRPAR